MKPTTDKMSLKFTIAINSGKTPWKQAIVHKGMWCIKIDLNIYRMRSSNGIKYNIDNTYDGGEIVPNWTTCP